MTKRSSMLIMGVLSIGFAMGVCASWWPIPGGTAHADALALKAAEKLYQDLKTNSSPLLDTSNHLAKVAKLCTPSVVHIQCERQGRRGFVEETGSGAIVTHGKFNGFYVISNRHVIDGTELHRISIHLHDGRVLTPMRLWTDKASDIAVMQIEAQDLQPIRWGDSNKLEIGNIVLAMGSPFGLSQSVTFGIISAKGRRTLELDAANDVLNQDFLQTDAAINPGNSGGPLINLQGEVVGINTAIASNSGGNDGIGFSIPSALAVHVIDQLLEFGRVQRAYLGVKLDPAFDLATARRLKLDRLRGARVLEVYPDTPAAKARLQHDDVVLTVDGQEVLDENHLINLVSLKPCNKDVTAVVLRQGQKITVTVRLTERPDPRQTSSTDQPGNGARIPKLGITVHELTPRMARELGYDSNLSGLLVLKVDTDSPYGNQLHLYDVIEEVARTPVNSIDDIEDLVRHREVIDSILLKIRRKVKDDTVTQVVTATRKRSAALVGE